MTPSCAETVRRAVARLREARFARILQYTADATGERTSVSHGQVDLRAGIADLELPSPEREGSVAMVVLRPPHSYLRKADGSWISFGNTSLAVSSESVTGILRLLESDALVATERGDSENGRAFDVRVDVEDAPVLQGTVWIGADQHVAKLERPARDGRIAGVEFEAIGQPLSLLAVPESVTARKS